MRIIAYILLGTGGIFLLCVIYYIMSWLQMGAWLHRMELHFKNKSNIFKNDDKEEK